MHSGAIDSGTAQGNGGLVKRHWRAVKLQRSRYSRMCTAERPGQTIVCSGRRLNYKSGRSVLELTLVQVAVMLDARDAQPLHARTIDRALP